MDEDFQSFIVDPNLVDEGIDVSGLKTKTDVSPFLLGNIPDYAGIQYEAFNPTRLTDLMRLYSSGLPMIDWIDNNQDVLSKKDDKVLSDLTPNPLSSIIDT